MKFLIVTIVIIVLLPHNLTGEENIALPLKHNPLKAGLLSALVPGGGQIYNRSYIKAGGIIVIEGFLLGYALKNHHEADKYYKKWQETEDPFAYQNYETYYEKRDNDIWWLGITIFLSTMDAVTDAYLFDFDNQRRKVRLKFKDKSLQLEYSF